MRLVVTDAAAQSDVGRLRQSNEDALLVCDPVFAVADGMGGARAGEVASAMAVAALHGVRSGTEGLTAAITDVNGRIHAAARTDAALTGMGTTVTAAIVDGDTLVFGHVGDSRAYVLRGGQLSQITDDHSLVGELIRRGALTAAEAERHPQRSVITRALGAEPHVDVDVVRLRPQPGDVILLCSDGLTGMVPDPEIERIVWGSATLAEAAQRLIDAANAAGGEDNISAVLLRLELADDEATAADPLPTIILPASALADVPSRPAPTSTSRRGRGVAIGVALAALGIVVAVVVAFGLQWSHFVGTTPEGRLAVYQGLPIEITSEITLTRKFRAELMLGGQVLDGIEDALVVFADDGAVLMANTAYREIWGDGAAEIGQAVARWEQMAGASGPGLHALREALFAAETTAPSSGAMAGPGGRLLGWTITRLAGGRIMLRFRQAASLSVPLSEGAAHQRPRSEPLLSKAVGAE